RHGLLGLVAAPARLEVRRQFVATLDRPHEVPQIVVPPSTPVVEGEADPAGDGKGRCGEQGGAKRHGKSPSAKEHTRTGTDRLRAVRPATVPSVRGVRARTADRRGGRERRYARRSDGESERQPMTASAVHGGRPGVCRPDLPTASVGSGVRGWG